VAVGHSVEGRFQFPDGSVATIAELESTLRESNRTGLVFSCDTLLAGTEGAAGTTNRIRPDVAANALQKVYQELGRLEDPRWGDFIAALDQHVRAGQRPSSGEVKRVLVSAIVGSLVIVIILLVLCDEESDCDVPFAGGF
jgi:hypothetical protein